MIWLNFCMIFLMCYDFATSQTPFTVYPSARDSSNPPDGVSETCWGHMVALQEKVDRAFISFNESDTWALRSEIIINVT